MKRILQKAKKFISFMLTLSIIFSMFSGVVMVQAAPEIINVRFVRTIDPETNNSKEALYILGSGFVEPVVRLGTTGTIAYPVNTSLSNEYTIVVDDPAAISEIMGKKTTVRVDAKNTDGTMSQARIRLNLEVLPAISGVSKTKAYVGTPLVISGTQLNELNEGADYTETGDPGFTYSIEDNLFVAGTRYNADTDYTKTLDSEGTSYISINSIKSPNNYGVSDVRIERTIKRGDEIVNEIVVLYKDSITVVNQLTGIDVERVDPNAGPRDRRNLVSIFGKTPATSNFTDDMRIFVGDKEGVNHGVITNDDGEVIGVRFELPTSDKAGVVDLILRNKSLSSEYVIKDGFIYLDIGNALSIDNDGIKPNFKKETEDKIVEIKGRNIGFFNGTGYANISNVSTNETIIGYSSYGSSGKFNDNTYYKVKYTGKYNNEDVTIIREFKFTIDGDATVFDSVYGGQNYSPVFELSKDTVYVMPANVNLNPNEPKSVDVSVRTMTTIFKEPGTSSEDIKYSRIEDYTVKNGFTYLPDEITPEITTVTPPYGPSSRDIYMSITGENFQVFEDGSLPEVRIGGRICEDVRVYDDDNNVVDGRIIQTGTKIRCILPGDIAAINGAVDVIIVNPSGGQKTLTNGFEFRNEGAGRVVTISSVKNDYADIRGGVVSGETIVITGDNFDTSADNNHRVIITIDGEKAMIVGRVSSDGKSVTIIPPPGVVPGMTKLQLINQDGSMAEADFEYRLITSSPKITSLVPSKGGKGAKLVIKGEDFILPDMAITNANDPKRKGTVVLLGGKELNAYKYNADGTINGDDGSIFYNDSSGDEIGYTLLGEMVKVFDSTTIYVDLPDKFYSFDENGVAYLKGDNIPIGNLKVEVVNPDGAKSKEEVFFTFMKPSTAPIITSMSPDSGSVTGGTVVTITGSGFKEDDLEVYFGSEKVTDLDFINATQIRVTAPRYPYPLPAGKDELTVPVMVVNYDGGTAVRDGDEGFTYKIPSSNPIITRLIADGTDTPVNSGSSAGGDDIIIVGMDFRRERDSSYTIEEQNLPNVYFNGVKAEVEWPANITGLIAERLIVKIPPSDVSGPVDIVLVNYDAGACTYEGFSYTMSKPVVTSITPNVVSKLGNVNLEIKGSGFRQGNLGSLFLLNDGTQEQIRRHTDDPVNAAGEIKTIVALGDETTGDKKWIDTVVGPFSTVIDDLRFEFERIDEGRGTIRVRYAATNAVVTRQLRDADGNVAERPMEIDLTMGDSHMFILNHSVDLGNSQCFDEGILVETTPSLITITRRIAPYASVNHPLGTKVTATAPPLDTEGNRSVYVINDDGGKASARVNVINPDSNPVIARIDPVNHGLLDNVVEPYNPERRDQYTELYTYVPIDGGAFLTITGSDFRRNVKVYMEDKPLEIVSKSPNDDQLVVKVPPGTEEDVGMQYRIIVLNVDGGMADSSQLEQPYYVEYKASSLAPVVETITPDRSSNGAANKVVITGDGFDPGVVVSLDGVPCITERGYRDENGVLVQEHAYLTVTIPAGISPGPKLVMVQNPDYGYTEVPNGITIISSPRIIDVLDSADQIIDPIVFSIEGGEKVKLRGIGFMPNAKVIIGGTLKLKSELAQGENGMECLGPDNREMVVVGGVMATDASVTDDDIINFTTPKLMSSKISIIVINADGGVSNVIGASYEKPRPDRPMGIEIEVVDGDTIRLEWDKVDKAEYYELYVSIKYDKKDRISYRYFTSVKPEDPDADRIIYFVEDLTPSTQYSFRIRSVNNYTVSDFGDSTKYVKTADRIISTGYQGTEEFQEALKEDKIVIKGNEIVYIAGDNSIGSSSGVIADFDKVYHSLSTLKSLELNYRQIIKYPDTKVRLRDNDVELNMTANNLVVSEAAGIDGLLQTDTMIRVSINRNLGAKGDDIRISLPRGYKFITNPFGIDMSIQVEKNFAGVKNLRGQADLTIKYDESKAKQFAGGVYIVCYDNYTKKLEIIETQKLSGALKAKISKNGAYAIVGKILK